MGSTADVYDDMNLYITPEKFFIEPKESNVLLSIDRASERVSLEHNTRQIPTTGSRRSVCGILGTITLISGKYLIVATHRIHVGYIAGQSVWRLAASDVIPYTRSTLHLTNEQNSDNKVYISMVEQLLNTPDIYFSYTYDLTHSLQRLHNTAPDFLQLSLYERADLRFVWNGHLLKTFASPEFHKFCLPIIHGFVSINQCVVNGNSFTLAIVSRRSVQRAGTRLFRRGVDHQGFVANFVETEQIVEFQGDRASFVQTRGSIPLFWQQLPDLRYKPPPKLIDGENHMSAFARHLEIQLMQYGRQVLVNLIDHRGAEQTLEVAFDNAVSQLNNSNVRYESFDFHAECRHMRWDRLSILLDRLAHEQDDFSCFLLTRDGTLASIQDGVFRTNCIDCLDRTNVVQSMLARRSLTYVLQKLNILRQRQTVEEQPSLEGLFKQIWADNADMVSVQYSGTGALKTDFTRTGKRTRMGLVKDGVNSLTRYYKNNFADGFRQDAIDLFLGHYVVQEGEGAVRSCPLRVDKGWKYVTFPSVLLIAVAMFMTCAVLPAEYSTETLLYLLFWGSMVIATGTTIFRHGPEFVDRPKLS